MVAVTFYVVCSYVVVVIMRGVHVHADSVVCYGVFRYCVV